jgi:hypothetical protein
MKRLSLVIAAWIGWLALPANAQVDVRISTAQEQFLPAESLEVAVKIGNFTGGPLRLGTHPRWIAFTVERSDGGVVNKLAEPVDVGEFTLQHSTTGTLRFDVAPQFALQQPGTYRITATLTPVAGQETFASAPLSVEIINGVRLNEDRTFGFHKPDGTVENRKYILQQANFLKHLRLYLRVTDANESQTLKVLQLGPMVTFEPPRWVMDRQSHLHILHQLGPDNFRYHDVDPDGVIQVRQTWRFSGRRPELRVNESGQIAVVGGVRRPDRSDLPPATPTDATKPALRPAQPVSDVDQPSLKKNAPATGKTR